MRHISDVDDVDKFFSALTRAFTTALIKGSGVVS